MNHRTLADTKIVDRVKKRYSCTSPTWHSSTEKQWRNEKNQRLFFDTFTQNNLGPQSSRKLGRSAVLTYYPSLPYAILHLFPDIGLQAHKFIRLPKSYGSKDDYHRIYLRSDKQPINDIKMNIVSYFIHSYFSIVKTIVGTQIPVLTNKWI